MADRINVYYNEPFDDSTIVDVNDTFIGTGAQTTFTLSQKTNLLLGATIQAGNVLYYFYNGGFTKDSTIDFTLSSPPGAGVGIVATGLSYLPFKAYDQSPISGVANPLVSEIPFFIGKDDTYLKKYIASVGYGGIQLSFVDQVSGDVVADATWMSIASATQDFAGTAMTYVSGPVLTADISAFCTVSGNVGATSTILSGNSSNAVAEFIDGDYIIINRGGITQEIRKFLSASSVAMIISPLTYDHYTGETVYASYRKFWGRCQVRESAVDNQATNFFNVALNVIGSIESRF